MATYKASDHRVVRVTYTGDPNYVKVSHTPDGVVVVASLADGLVEEVEVEAIKKKSEKKATREEKKATREEKQAEEKTEEEVSE